MKVYGATKVWRQLHREGNCGALHGRATDASPGLEGASAWQDVRTTIADDGGALSAGPGQSPV